MLSLPKHLYRSSNSFTTTREMLRQAQHDALFCSQWVVSGSRPLMSLLPAFQHEAPYIGKGTVGGGLAEVVREVAVQALEG